MTLELNPKIILKVLKYNFNLIILNGEWLWKGSQNWIDRGIFYTSPTREIQNHPSVSD